MVCICVSGETLGFRFAALMAPLTSSRVTIAASSMNTTKVLSIRRVVSLKPNEP
ncbi:hypothetical protein Hdeb2414_s0171g00822281 [Helianthus debilis subsp. tardiflorus]